MKYKVGDTVLVQAEVVAVNDDITDQWPLKVRFSEDETNWFSESDLFKLPKPDKTYEQGLQDAWELARKLVYCVENGGFTTNEMNNIFGLGTYTSILRRYTPQEALAKLKEYEEAQTIKVGDVVEFEDRVGVVLSNAGMFLTGISEDGTPFSWCKKDCKKTGKHIDIAGLLEQIKGE